MSGSRTPRIGADQHDVTELIVDSDQLVGEGGFLKIRRLHLRNRRADGTVSKPYVADCMARPYGQDAVIVAIWTRSTTGIDVLVREGMRATLFLGREAAIAPLPEAAPTLFLTELVAGILETGDRGAAGLRSRAAAEVAEEAGFVVASEQIVVLGAGALAAPGALVEKFYFTAVEVERATQGPLAGDGSPMEEGARTRWLPLEAALAACVRGEISDVKTELGLRRLQDWLRDH